jgi:hypothetical protein
MPQFQGRTLRSKNIGPVPVACELSRKTDNVTSAIRLLAEQAREAGLLEQAKSFELLADDANLISIELDVSVLNVFYPQRLGEEICS